MHVLDGSRRQDLEFLLIEILNDLGGQVFELQVSYLRNDVLAGYLLVPLPCADPHAALRKVEPVTDVLSYGDALIVVVDALVDLGQGFVEFPSYFPSGLAIDLPSLAIGLISGLPTTVLPLGYGVFAFGPSHGSPFVKGSDRVSIGINRGQGR